jgi:hypothetical protein
MGFVLQTKRAKTMLDTEWRVPIDELYNKETENHRLMGKAMKERYPDVVRTKDHSGQRDI